MYNLHCFGLVTCQVPVCETGVPPKSEPARMSLSVRANVRGQSWPADIHLQVRETSERCLLLALIVLNPLSTQHTPTRPSNSAIPCRPQLTQTPGHACMHACRRLHLAFVVHRRQHNSLLHHSPIIPNRIRQHLAHNPPMPHGTTSLLRIVLALVAKP